MRTTCIDGAYKNFAIADAATVCAARQDGLDDLADHGIVEDHLNLYFWKKVDHIFCPAIQLRVPTLATKALHLAAGHASDADGLEGLFDLIQLEGL